MKSLGCPLRPTLIINYWATLLCICLALKHFIMIIFMIIITIIVIIIVIKIMIILIMIIFARVSFNAGVTNLKLNLQVY